MTTGRSEAQRGSVRLAAAMRSTHREMRCSAAVPLPTAKSLPLAPAGTASNFAWSGKKTATLYRVTVPADPVLVHGNRLGGAKAAAGPPSMRRAAMRTAAVKCRTAAVDGGYVMVAVWKSDLVGSDQLGGDLTPTGQKPSDDPKIRIR